MKVKNLNIKFFIVALSYLVFPLRSITQENLYFNMGELTIRPGFVFEKRLTDFNSFGAGLNLIATHGLLKSGNIHYYGLEFGFHQAQTISRKFNGLQTGVTYQLVRNMYGINFNNSYLRLADESFVKTELGISFLGFVSINYGYYFSLDNSLNLLNQNVPLTLKLSLNLSYGESFNIVGASDKRW